jgi:hypothetical protein
MNRNSMTEVFTPTQAKTLATTDQQIVFYKK